MVGANPSGRIELELSAFLHHLLGRDRFIAAFFCSLSKSMLI